MADDFDVDCDVVAEKIDDISSGVTLTTGDLEALGDDVDELNAAWSGQAQQAFQLAYELWEQNYTEHTGFLGRMGTALQSINELYEAAEADVVAQCS